MARRLFPDHPHGRTYDLELATLLSIVTIAWNAVVGAAWYDVHVEQPNSGPRDFRRIRSTALTFTRMSGTGNFRWKVRADFASGSGSGGIPGPYSAWHSFTRTIAAPNAPRLERGARSLVFSWSSKPGAKPSRSGNATATTARSDPPARPHASEKKMFLTSVYRLTACMPISRPMPLRL